MSGRELMVSHVARFNDGVRTGDWEPMLARLAADAELVFVNAPAGPVTGIEAIRRAYAEQPPDDEIRLLGIQDDEQRGSVTAAFTWVRGGGTGRLVLEHERRGLVTRLVVIFDE